MFLLFLIICRHVCLHVGIVLCLHVGIICVSARGYCTEWGCLRPEITVSSGGGATYGSEPPDGGAGT